VIGQILFDSGNQVWYASENSAMDTFFRNFAKPALDPVQPRTRSWNKMQVESWMPSEPRLYARMFVCTIIVHNQVKVFPRQPFE